MSSSACKDAISAASRTRSTSSWTQARAKLPRGSQITDARPGRRPCSASFFGLGVGVAMAIVLVYLLIVVNFQSWIDPLIIISALPAALAGIAWMLFITGTT